MNSDHSWDPETEHLDLSGQDLRELPEGVRELTKLKRLELRSCNLTSLPEWLGQLTQLTVLDLDSNGLTSLPKSLGHLTRLTRLYLRDNGLMSLPESLGHLTRLTRLYLHDNGLTSVPESLGQLTQLTVLDLDGNGLTSLPESLGQLTQVTALYLRDNDLTSVPESLGQLTDLTWLDLGHNGLTSVPESLGQLTRLSRLDLRRNGLTSLPESLGQLTQLTVLDLGRNGLTSVPESLGQLTQLTRLDLRGNGLTTVPASLGQLTQLTRLDLRGNGLASLPESLGQLTQLTELSLGGTGLASVPEWLGQLTQLTDLDLHGNELTSLPASLGQMTYLRYLSIAGNPLPAAYFDLLESNLAEFLRYISTVGRSRYDLKVLLVGQGGVGKSSLIAAMQGEEFVEGRSTTHGIEVTSLAVDHPEAQDQSLSLNFWDFGGQEIYWTTNQLFFSRNAIYLVVWKPRDGLLEPELEEVLERIRRRAGATAQVLIVATHCQGDRRCDLDFAELQLKFPDLIAGQAEVDSLDRTGIAELEAQLVQLACDFEHIKTPWPDEWIPARTGVLESGKEQMTLAAFESHCVDHGLDALRARAMLALLEVSGLIVHHDSDGLRDFVVLDPEWLTKAVSYVLEDRVTSEARGYLDHRRLRAIWHDHGRVDREVYDPAHFPYFLRLMEEFDVCYRVQGEASSLVAQLVPHQRPELPWEPSEATKDGQLSSTCIVDSAPTGIIAWQTVRNHRLIKDGLHWRKGVFLEDVDGHQAIVELSAAQDVRITVRGKYPAHLASVLRHGLLATIADRWPHMGTSWEAPCPTTRDGQPCNGSFDLDKLAEALAQDISTMQCRECFQSIEIASFLLGYRPPLRDLDERFNEITESLARIESGVENLAAQRAELVREIFSVLEDEAKHGPRVFSIVKVRGGLTNDRHRATFWCEHPRHEHPLWGKDESYELRLNNAVFAVIAPALRVASRIMRLAVPVVSAAASLGADQLLGTERAKGVTEQIKASSEVLDRLKHLDVGAIDRAFGGRGEARDISALRAFHEIVAAQHPDRVGTTGTRRWDPLRKVIDKTSNDVLWVCPEHYKIYDPGLPVLPT